MKEVPDDSLTNRQDRILKELVLYISSVTGYDSKDIKLSTRINFDVRIDGDDAGEFMVGFSKKFGVDLSTFKFKEYFSDEGLNLVYGIFLFVFNRKALMKRPLYVEDLVRSALLGCWN